jgi:lipid II:glycine glycyltransferase (peptidoglycan interpeptide bridge formation enzyme)
MEVRLAQPSDRDAWDAFVAARPEADPLQAWAWGEANATAGERPTRVLATAAGGEIRGLAQLLVRPAGFGRTVVYAPHGPVWDRDAGDAGAVLDALADGIRGQTKAERAIVVKVDPRAAATPGPGDVAEWLVARGFHPARHDLQARTTRVLDLLDGGDELIASWDKDARNLVRRSAKEGVTTATHRTADASAIGAFHELLEVTSSRAGFRIRSTTFLRTLAEELARTDGWFLTIASLGERPIAGAIALRAGDRAIYAYGASLREPELKHANGAYAALAATMRALAENGVRTLDLWGVVEPGDPEADAEWAGFSAFKRQFGGEQLLHPGTFDLVIDPLFYRLRDLRERLRG